jgi:Ala-tRNA(Pro) deacylase
MSLDFDRIVALLKAGNIPYQVLEHEAVYTSEEAARVRGTRLDQAAKALILQADGKPLLLVVPGDRRVDTKGFKRQFAIRDLRMATREEVKQLTGLAPGSIPPFGNVIGLQTYMEELLLEKDEVVFNAGSHTRSIKMRPSDLVVATQPVLGNFSMAQ